MNYYVYILTNEGNKTLYVGVTNNLQKRLYEHKTEMVEGFTKRYHIHKLVYYEMTKDITAAIEREKQLKGWIRYKKVRLIESFNPMWNDLSKDF